MDNWPSLLLLSDEGPQTSTAGGMVLFRLLEDYPKERLRVIERRVEPGCTRLPCRYETLTTPGQRFEHTRFHRWKNSLRAFGLVPPVPLRRIESLLDGFRPEVVLCVMECAAYYDCAWSFARKHGLPLVVIVHDVNDQFEPVLPFALGAARRRDGAFYRFASRRLCVSPEMEALCVELYAAHGDVLYPNPSEELQPRRFAEAWHLKQPGRLTVGFAGNLNYGYGEELLRLLPAFRAAQARLVLFSKPPGGAAAALQDAKDCCEFRGFAPTALTAWHAIQKDCDAVILPYPNPPGAWERLIRHHFPSKLPEYLALGLPVLVTGPDYATGVTWALKHPEAAAVCTSVDLAEPARLLARLRKEAPLRLALAEGARCAGLMDFDPRKIKAEFLGHLRTVAAEKCALAGRP